MIIPQQLRDLERFYYILESIEMIEEYVGTPPKVEDIKTSDAIFFRLQIIGEASKNIHEHHRAKFDDIPWRKMIAMRNYLVHEYFAIHMDKIMAALIDIPRVKQRIQQINC